MIDSFGPGLHFILGFEGTAPDRDFIKLIDEYPPSGIIFFSSNYESPSQLKELVLEFRSIIGQDAIFAIDQEPGRVQRLVEGFPRSKMPSSYINDGSAAGFIDWCRETAVCLRDVGLNLNLVPVVDLRSFSRKSAVLADRSFGDDVKRVKEFARILIDEHKKSGILTCAKHFPGLGSASEDPHEEISISDEPVERFYRYHWEPFRAAVDAGVDSVMTTHLLARSLDNENPATYSSKIIDLLRSQLGFSGAVISDDMIMKGAGDGSTLSGNVARSLEIGHNLIIISKNIDLQRQALENVRRRTESDDQFREILHSHGRIIERLKKKIRF